MQAIRSAQAITRTSRTTHPTRWRSSLVSLPPSTKRTKAQTRDTSGPTASEDPPCRQLPATAAAETGALASTFCEPTMSSARTSDKQSKDTREDWAFEELQQDADEL